VTSGDTDTILRLQFEHGEDEYSDMNRNVLLKSTAKVEKEAFHECIDSGIICRQRRAPEGGGGGGGGEGATGAVVAYAFREDTPPFSWSAAQAQALQVSLRRSLKIFHRRVAAGLSYR